LYVKNVTTLDSNPGPFEYNDARLIHSAM